MERYYEPHDDAACQRHMIAQKGNSKCSRTWRVSIVTETGARVALCFGCAEYELARRPAKNTK